MYIQPGSAEWYHERFPGFYNLECYKILEKWHHGIPDNVTPEESVYEFGSKPKITISKKQQRKKRCLSKAFQEEVIPVDDVSCLMDTKIQEPTLNPYGC